jgi:inner membrane protein
MRQLKGELTLDWNGRSIVFSPGSGTTDFIRSGIQASSLKLEPQLKGHKIPFSLKLHLAGSNSMNFLPFGMTTKITMQSLWPNPSFIGAFLPEHRQITKDGFKAAWEISHFGRAYPQILATDQLTDDLHATIEKSNFGVRFLQPVDSYRQSERAIKYGMLFIVFNFLTYFLFELTTGVRIHIFQYVLVGVALCIFFLLLIALAEHIGFAWAYTIGAASVISQISLYSFKVVKTLKRTLTVSAVLALLYVYLYIALCLEDYALLIGSLGLFIGLAFIMFVVRNVDWFAEAKEQPTLP